MGRQLGLVLFFLLDAFMQGCTAYQAKIPEELATSPNVWNVSSPPQGHFFNKRKQEQMFQVGPFKTSVIEEGFFSDPVVKNEWSNTFFEKGSNKDWLNFKAYKGHKFLGEIACLYSVDKTTYGSAKSQTSFVEKSRGCEIRTKYIQFWLNSVDGEVSLVGLNKKPIPYSIEFTQETEPKSIMLKTGIKIFSVKKERTLLSWINTFHEDGPRFIFSEQITGRDEAVAVATGFAYLALNHYLCENC